MYVDVPFHSLMKNSHKTPTFLQILSVIYLSREPLYKKIELDSEKGIAAKPKESFVLRFMDYCLHRRREPPSALGGYRYQATRDGP